MADTDDSTLSSITEAVQSFAPPEEYADLPSEQQLREYARFLALGVAYGWISRDPQAQDALLDELVDLPHGLGVTFAVELYTTIRLSGAGRGSLRTGVAVTTEWVPTENPATRPGTAVPAEVSAGPPGDRRECVTIITDLWSGAASGDAARETLARAQMARLPRSQVREMIRIMAYDAYKAMERFEILQGLGAEAVQEYRLKHPEDYQVGRTPWDE